MYVFKEKRNLLIITKHIPTYMIYILYVIYVKCYFLL